MEMIKVKCPAKCGNREMIVRGRIAECTRCHALFKIDDKPMADYLLSLLIREAKEVLA